MAREDWKRLASYVVARRVALGYQNRRAFAKVLSVSWRTLSSLEAGQPVGANTLAMVENALYWRPGSAQATLAGGEPQLLDSAKEAAVPELRDDVERQLWEIRGLSDDEKRGFIAYHRALLDQEREAAIRRTG